MSRQAVIGGRMSRQAVIGGCEVEIERYPTTILFVQICLPTIYFKKILTTMMISVLLKRLREDAQIPKYQTSGSAACDLCACMDEPLTLGSGETALVPTGIAIAPDTATQPVVALIYARSGLAAKHGIALPNGVGVIDSDYRGEIFVALRNHSDVPYTINSGDRIAQMVFTPILHAAFEPVADLDETDRGVGGFGSTGVG